MGIYLVYLAVGVVVFLVGVVGFALADWYAESATGDHGGEADPEPWAAMLRSIPLFVAIVGLGGILFGGVGVLAGLLG